MQRSSSWFLVWFDLSQKLLGLNMGQSLAQPNSLATTNTHIACHVQLRRSEDYFLSLNQGHIPNKFIDKICGNVFEFEAKYILV